MAAKKKFTVFRNYTVTHMYEVEAENKEEAKRLAQEGEGYSNSHTGDYHDKIDVEEGWD